MEQNSRRIIRNILATAAALALWQAAAMLLDQKILLASPIEVAIKLFKLPSEGGFVSSVLFSLGRILGGFALGVLLGTLLAALAARYSLLETLFKPYMTTVKSVPVASFVVIALIWLSSSGLSVFISFLMVLPIVYTNILTGLKAADSRLSEAADVFKMSPLRRLIYIRLPALKSYVISSCSVSLGLAWKAGTAAEIIGIPEGSIGERLYQAKLYLATDELLAWTVVIVGCSFICEKLTVRLIKLIFREVERL